MRETLKPPERKIGRFCSCWNVRIDFVAVRTEKFNVLKLLERKYRMLCSCMNVKKEAFIR